VITESHLFGFRHHRREAWNQGEGRASDRRVLLAPDGMFFGRQAIEKRYADAFQQSPITTFSHATYGLNAIDNAVWSVGEWWGTLQGETGPVLVRGYESAIYVREGDAWKIRTLTVSEKPRLVPVAGTK